jgi:hypothetical protein
MQDNPQRGQSGAVGLIGQQRPGEKVARDDPAVSALDYCGAAAHEKVGEHLRDFLRTIIEDEAAIRTVLVNDNGVGSGYV